MRCKLCKNMILCYGFFAIITTVCVHYCMSTYSEHLMEEKAAKNLYSKAVSIASDYGYNFYNNTLTRESLVRCLNTTTKLLNADIWVVSASGQVTAASRNPDASLPNKIQNFKISDMFGSNYYTLGTFHSTFDEDYISVYAPITLKYNVAGYVMIHKPLSSLAETYALLNKVTRMVTFVIIAMSLGLLFAMQLLFIRPINKIVYVAEEYSKDNFKPQIKSKKNDEISYIGNVMSFMATKIDTHEESQRKFISNVSHDFKSPLTSIRGYIQAMLDGTIPMEQYPKYLTIIFNEAERLTQLTNNLLDLNRIGSRDFIIELKDFDINTVIKDCAQSVEGQCIEKGIEISLVLTGETMMVNADRSKIQQVLYNLIDNAIKFSSASSTITIETSCRADKLLVSVKDQGCGIPKDSLNNVWKRFYKTDASRGKDKKGTGLGLSIVKEIIQAHSETIDVVSTEGAGSEFTFSLQLSEEETA
ncbi:MAG: HAMP domain-containing histidine kinase [Lachnospiraceae bacterium]|nr:HAMP domain-containing histidine kinase [Lachnospiraceae bacterium]